MLRPDCTPSETHFHKKGSWEHDLPYLRNKKESSTLQLPPWLYLCSFGRFTFWPQIRSVGHRNPSASLLQRRRPDPHRYQIQGKGRSRWWKEEKSQKKERQKEKRWRRRRWEEASSQYGWERVLDRWCTCSAFPISRPSRRGYPRPVFTRPGVWISHQTYLEEWERSTGPRSISGCACQNPNCRTKYWHEEAPQQRKIGCTNKARERRTRRRKHPMPHSWHSCSQSNRRNAWRGDDIPRHGAQTQNWRRKKEWSYERSLGNARFPQERSERS